jgi:putative phage-type endonuclease
MSYVAIDVPQRSQAWYEARLGRLCASDAGKMLTGGKEAKTRTGLRDRLVAERLTGKSAEDSYTNADMERGVELEPVARDAYQARVGIQVAQVGFLQCVEHMAGASPDGVIGEMVGLVEIKCPRTARHLSWLKNGIPSEHRPQLLHQLWISGAGWVDFVTFDPWLPKNLRIGITRLDRDEAEIAAYEKSALAFLRDVETEVLSWQTLGDPVGQMGQVVGL